MTRPLLDHAIERARHDADPAPMSEQVGAAELQRLAGPLFDAMRASCVAMVVTAPLLADNPIVFVNDAFTTLTLYRPDEVLGRNCRMMQGPRTAPASVSSLRAAILAGRAARSRILNYRADGTAFWADLSITPIHDEAGQIVLFMSQQVDVTAAERADAIAQDLDTSKQELRESAKRLRITRSIAGTAAVWDWHIEDRRIVGDQGFAELYGLGVEQAAAGIESGIFFSIIHPQDVGRVRLAMGGMVHGAELLSKEFRVLAPGGRVRWVHARARADYDAQGRPARFSGVLIDITDQKNLEEQLRIAQTAGGVGTFQHVGGFGTASVSAQFCSLLGLYPATNLPVRTINDVVHPGDPPVIDLDESARAGAASRAEFRIRRADTGESRWLTRRGEYLSDAQTEGLRFSGVIYDITDAKRVETELRTLNETLESRVAQRTRERDRIWRVSPDLLGVSDTQGRWISVNPAWTSLLGWSESEILGRNSEWMVHPDDLVSARESFASLCAGSRPAGFDARYAARDGSYRWLSWVAVPEDDEIYHVARDVTAEKAASRILAETEEQLRQSQKMEAVGQLTGGLAHDFNNLLSGIAGSLELMQTRVRQGRFDQLGRYMAAAQAASTRAAALTHRLLAFSRRQTLDPRPTEPNALVSGMEELVRRTVGPGITVSIDRPADLWSTLVDPNQLENALLNLCINARDAMQGGGRLEIGTANHLLDAARARELELPPGAYVALSVGDSGTGMTQEVMARAFDPFFTTKPIGQGTGLGLSMIYGFVKQSGGQVRIVSQPGQGTVATLYLPRHEGGEADGDEAERPGVASDSRRSGTVLVVDDEPTVRMLMTEALDDLGYTVVQAEDGPEGLRILRSGARIDLLVTDVGLPGGMNGRQLADAARVARPGLRILFVTGFAQKGLLDHGDLAAGMHILAKPFALDLFATMVGDLLGDPRR